MKPVGFDYIRPATVSDAVKLLDRADGQAKLLAGSQSLGPMLNMRLAQPNLLVDITALEELCTQRDFKDAVELGACVTHSDIEDGRIDDPSRGLLPHVAASIAYRAVRNRGTIGGSLAHADPAADWLSALPLVDAVVMIRTLSGRRELAVADLMISSFSTALADAEMIEAVRVPKLSKAARWGYYKFNQKAGEFAHAIGAVVHDPARDMFRAVIGAIETTPIIFEDASELFDGGLKAAGKVSFDEPRFMERLDEKGINQPHRRKLLLVCLKRAAEMAVRS